MLELLATLGRTHGLLVRRRHQPVRDGRDPRLSPSATAGSHLPEQFRVFDNDCRDRRRARALRHRVRRGQDSVGRFGVGCGPHRHPADWRRRHRRRDSRRRQPDGRRAWRRCSAVRWRLARTSPRRERARRPTRAPSRSRTGCSAFREDMFVVGPRLRSRSNIPPLAAVVVILGVVVMLVFATWIVRAVKRRWGRGAQLATSHPS